ncbi:MAG: ATP synthase F1 subunit delta [Archaeoglobaceae archaeon]
MKIERELNLALDELIKLVDSENYLHEFHGEVHALLNLIISVKGLRQLIYTEEFDPGKKKEVFRNILEGRFSPFLLALVNLLIDRNKIGKLPQVLQNAKLKTERLLRKRKAEVITATEISEETRKKIEEVVSKLAPASAKLEFRLDPELIGGVILRIGDLYIDASVKGRLERFKRRVMERL